MSLKFMKRLKVERAFISVPSHFRGIWPTQILFSYDILTIMVDFLLVTM